MKSLSFRKDLIGVQEELLRFAYKLTANREEANDLLQETSLKALDNEEKYHRKKYPLYLKFIIKKKKKSMSH